MQTPPPPHGGTLPAYSSICLHTHTRAHLTPTNSSAAENTETVEEVNTLELTHALENHMSDVSADSALDQENSGSLADDELDMDTIADEVKSPRVLKRIRGVKTSGVVKCGKNHGQNVAAEWLAETADDWFDLPVNGNQGKFLWCKPCSTYIVLMLRLASC